MLTISKKSMIFLRQSFVHKIARKAFLRNLTGFLEIQHGRISQINDPNPFDISWHTKSKF